MMRQGLVEMGLNQILVLYILLNTNLQILLPGINTSFGAYDMYLMPSYLSI